MDHMDTAFRLNTDSPALADAYLSLRLAPGTAVTYTGTKPAWHRGEWTVQPCACGTCLRKVLLGIPSTRYRLCTAKGTPAGLSHVRHSSVVPVMGEDERQHAGIYLPTRLVALHLRRQLRAAFPGTTFSVRTGTGRANTEITVRWSGPLDRTAVGTVAAPLLATYGNPRSVAARSIGVASNGRTYWGTPIVSAIHLLPR
jgi:hypothetical protein